MRDGNGADAVAAMAMARDARRRLADRMVSPVWYAPLYGLGCGGMIASQGLSGPLSAVGASASLLLVTVLYAVWSRRAGVVVNGYRRGSTLPITLALVTALLALLAVAVIARHRFGIAWAPLACGMIAAIVAGWASRAWDARWRADMIDIL